MKTKGAEKTVRVSVSMPVAFLAAPPV